MSFVIDTDTCSAHIKGHPLVHNRFLQYGGRLYISIVTLAELTIWARRAKAPPQRAKQVNRLLKSVVQLDATVDVAEKFGEVQAGLMDIGLSALDFDLMIAATALVHGYAIVTHNTADFANIPGLTIVDWLMP